MRSCNIITGEKGEGKTTLINTLCSLSSSPVGFISIHRGDEYYMRNIESGEERLLMSRNIPLGGVWKGWNIDFSLFDEVYKRMESIYSGSVYLDECGRMEIEGRGYCETIKLLKERDVDLFITIRRPFLKEFLSSFSIVDYSLLPVCRRADFQ